MKTFRPDADSRVLDLGTANSTDRASNFLEAWYPWPERIVAVGIDPLPVVLNAFPAVRAVRADARRLPFPDRHFDIGFANALIEHVGTRTQQAHFAEEMLRTCRRVFVTTPNRWFPIDPHTLFPVVHWLPARARSWALKTLGRPAWANELVLNPLSAGDLRQCFSAASTVEIVHQRMAGLTANLVCIASA